MRHTRTSLLLLLSGLLLVGCQTGPTLPKGATMVTVRDNGSRVTLQTGQAIVIELERNPSTGYVWQLVRQVDQGILMPDGTKDWKTAEERASQSNLEMQLLRFVAQGSGTATLQLNYVQPDVGPTADTANFTVYVTVE
ncbi:MAG: protease inhibitor I42 family protein [Phycisphaerales bacterium]|nr:protease inhibitor I42 family protein [Phycisphaerales bacterium]